MPRKIGDLQKVPRRCRVSQANTTSIVQRAFDSWCLIFSHETFSLDFGHGHCDAHVKSLKSFLSEPPVHVSEDQAFAFRSIKKLLPPSCSCLESSLLDRVREGLTRKAIRLPDGYLSFCVGETRKFFKKGWDRSYPDHCFTTTPPVKGCIEASKSSGGTMSQDLDQVAFLDRVLEGVPFDVVQPEAEMIVVQSAGKPRPLSKFSCETLILKPLHKTLYDRISRSPWLCRGDPTAEVLRRAGFAQGRGTLVSGDYASATDNLPIEVAEIVLREALNNSLHVPGDIKKYALSILRPLLYETEPAPVGHDTPRTVEYENTRGQMMGSYLSFPLLCFQNYLAFKWAVHSFGMRDRLPLLINGDDILFQSDRAFADHWMSVVSDVGLEVERSKTSISDDFGSLNSTLFCWRNGALVPRPTLRFGLLRPAEFPNCLGTSFSKFVGGQRPDVAFKAAKVFFRFHLNTLRSVRLTLDELGFRGSLARRVAKNLFPPSH